MSYRSLLKFLTSFFVLANSFCSLNAQNSSPLSITPHRAEYDITFKGSRLPQTIKKVKGSLTIAITDRGDGWTFEQQCFVEITNSDGLTDKLRTTIASWEAKDGKHYTFTVASSCNDQILECSRGHATSDKDHQGVVIFQQPQGHMVRLPPNTSFPLRFLRTILSLIGSHKFSLPNQKVFDGLSDSREAVDINLTITPLKPSLIINNKNIIDVDKAWTVQMAVFSPEDDESSPVSEPIYEVTQTLLKSGIILSMTMPMDYGDETFKAQATLRDVKIYLPTS